MSDVTNAIDVNGKSWTKVVEEGEDGFWYEHTAEYGDLVVERDFDGTFWAGWWPADTHSATSAILSAQHETPEEAMEAAHDYIERLRELLGKQE